MSARTLTVGLEDYGAPLLGQPLHQFHDVHVRRPPGKIMPARAVGIDGSLIDYVAAGSEIPASNFFRSWVPPI
ncbi:hypothetical protein [Streptomyces sp. NBC_00467]|uniref:hypothetical protein n=1 Tax=Streptomyces sp. NBC_00467 TaxID=2975752 RepID=UPI002E18D8E8